MRPRIRGHERLMPFLLLSDPTEMIDWSRHLFLVSDHEAEKSCLDFPTQ